MNAKRIFLTLAAVSTAVVLAQSTAKPAAEQRYFNLVDAVQTSQDLTDAELAVLANDDLMRKHTGAAGGKLTQEGLAAAAVHLCGADERDLIVIGNSSAFATTYAGPFWVIRDLASGPVVVLSETSLSLSVDTKRSNKCLNMASFAVTATEGVTTEYKFDGQKYVAGKQKSAKLL